MSSKTRVSKELYGTLPDGREVNIYTLSNGPITARITEYGAILVSLEAPDRRGNIADITAGYDTLEGWLKNPNYLGATVGRFGNRIAHGKFSLDEKEYTLETNNSPGGIPCHLHGGRNGFDKVLWKSAINAKNGIEFTYVSRNNEEGYPGELTIRITYALSDEKVLTWDVEATSDAPTIVNIIQHTYWNLSGDFATCTGDHLLTLHADSYLPTDPGQIPTGKIAPVDGTPMDFTQPTAIGARVEQDFGDLKIGAGYDHAWIIRGRCGKVHLAAHVADPKSGRTLEVSTDQPAIQFYGGNFLDGESAGKKGIRYGRRCAFALETEAFPDAPNQPQFPSTTLRPGEIYRHHMAFKFSSEK